MAFRISLRRFRSRFISGTRSRRSLLWPRRAEPRKVARMAESWMAGSAFRGDHGPTMTRVLDQRVGVPASRRGRRQPDGGRPPGTRRGRHSRESRLRALQVALRRINSAWELSQSPLAHYRDLQELGRTQFAGRAFPEGWAVQAVLRLACTRVASALEPRKGEFLRRWVAGESIAGIAASAGMSRSHLSRRWRPEVLAAVDAEIANLLRELRSGSGRSVHEAVASGPRHLPAGGAAHESGLQARATSRPN